MGGWAAESGRGTRAPRAEASRGPSGVPGAAPAGPGRSRQGHAPGEGDGDGLLLDGRRLLEALLVDAHKQFAFQEVVLEVVALSGCHVLCPDALVLRRQHELLLPVPALLRSLVLRHRDRLLPLRLVLRLRGRHVLRQRPPLLLGGGLLWRVARRRDPRGPLLLLVMHSVQVEAAHRLCGICKGEVRAHLTVLSKIQRALSEAQVAKRVSLLAPCYQTHGPRAHGHGLLCSGPLFHAGALRSSPDRASRSGGATAAPARQEIFRQPGSSERTTSPFGLCASWSFLLRNVGRHRVSVRFRLSPACGWLRGARRTADTCNNSVRPQCVERWRWLCRRGHRQRPHEVPHAAP